MFLRRNRYPRVYVELGMVDLGSVFAEHYTPVYSSSYKNVRSFASDPNLLSLLIKSCLAW